MTFRFLRISLYLMAILSAPSSVANSEYWVAVGSYRDLNGAETVRAEATRLLPESFTVSQFETDGGYWYRVLAGPYLSRGIADHMREEAIRVGFDNAWILATKTGDLPYPDMAGSRLSDFPDTDLLEDYESLRSDAGSYSGGTGNRLGDDETDISVQERARELVDEPPPGFQLHRMQRR